MKIELKNVKVNLTFSKETTMFQADVFVNGIKCAYADNDGWGGCTNYHAYDGKRDLLAQAEAYCKTLPSETHEIKGMDKSITIDMNLEYLIDKMVDDHVNAKENAKFDKKVQKSCIGNFVWGVPNSGKYRVWGYGNKADLADMMKHPQTKAQVLALLKKVKAELKEGEVIFNTNIPLV